MTEKVELKVNSKNLSSVISLLKKKYMIIGGSWTGKSEPIALKLAKFCIRVDDNPKQKSDIISLLLKYDEDDLNRKHAFIGISAADLLILLFNEEMKLSINNNCLTTKYYEKTLNTTRNLHGLLLEDILLNSQDKLHVEVNMTIDIKFSSSNNIGKTSLNDVVQEDNSSNNVVEETSLNDIVQEDNSSNNVVEETSLNDVVEEDNSSNNDVVKTSLNDIVEEDNSSNNDVVKTSLNDIVQEDNSSNNVVGNNVENTVDDKDDNVENVDNDVKDILKILFKRLIVKLLMDRLEY
jgi:hypothetical protein